MQRYDSHSAAQESHVSERPEAPQQALLIATMGKHHMHQRTATPTDDSYQYQKHHLESEKQQAGKGETVSGHRGLAWGCEQDVVRNQQH
jgi:hypothetical protein